MDFDSRDDISRDCLASNPFSVRAHRTKHNDIMMEASAFGTAQIANTMMEQGKHDTSELRLQMITS